MSIGLLTAAALGTLLSVPFWHAPALVHWGGQGVRQALFSSTLALWRTKGAFVTYMLAWGGVLLAVRRSSAALLFGLIGAPQLAGVVGVPAGLVFSTVFYVSLLFTFNDSFGAAPSAPRDRDAACLRRSRPAASSRPASAWRSPAPATCCRGGRS